MVVALGVVTLITVGIVILATDSIRNSTFSKNKTLASRYAQEVIEWLRQERDKSSSDFANYTVIPTYCFDNLSWSNIGPCGSDEFISNTNLTREVNFTSSLLSGKNLLEVLVVVSWSDSQGVHEARSTTNFADGRQQ